MTRALLYRVPLGSLGSTRWRSSARWKTLALAMLTRSVAFSQRMRLRCQELIIHTQEGQEVHNAEEWHDAGVDLHHELALRGVRRADGHFVRIVADFFFVTIMCDQVRRGPNRPFDRRHGGRVQRANVDVFATDSSGGKQKKNARNAFEAQIDARPSCQCDGTQQRCNQNSATEKNSQMMREDVDHESEGKSAGGCDFKRR